jgi:DNA invertase Pin-like site-specific DNA recombinase
VLYATYTAETLGTTRTSKNVVEAQERDMQLYIDNFIDSSLENGGKFTGGHVLHEWLFSVNNPNKEITNALAGEAYFLVAYLSSIGRNNEEVAQVIDKLHGLILVAELPNATAEELKVYAKLEDSKKQFMGIRSKAGIEQAKADGKNVGGLRGKTKERNDQKNKEANDMAESLKSYLQMFIQRDFTLKQGADLLNERGLKTAQGKEFKPMTVKRYLDRLKD